MTHLKIGLVTDAHFASVPDRDGRCYRMSEIKIAEAADHFRLAGCDAVVQMGDLKDMDVPPDPARALEYYRHALSVLARFPGPIHTLIGNHDLDCLVKEDLWPLLAESSSRAKEGYLCSCKTECTAWCADMKGFRLIGLDACFRAEGSATTAGHIHWDEAMIPPDELDWLTDRLRSSPHPTVVFCHQRLDQPDDPSFGVRNAATVRARLEQTAPGCVQAVFQGHFHGFDQQSIGGIPYLTLPAMTGGPEKTDTAFAVLDLSAGHMELELLGRNPARISLPLRK